jgi:hypothetical protein
MEDTGSSASCVLVEVLVDVDVDVLGDVLMLVVDRDCCVIEEAPIAERRHGDRRTPTPGGSTRVAPAAVPTARVN